MPMPRALTLQAAFQAEEVAAGLQIFADYIPPEEVDIQGCIHELIALSKSFLDLEHDHPDYLNISNRLATDVALVLQSLDLTIRQVRVMFGETRQITSSGRRAYRRAWDDLERRFMVGERSYGLLSRLATYSIFMQNILASLNGDRVEAGQIVRDRDRISRMLEEQALLEEQFAGTGFNQPPEWARQRPPPMPHFPNFPFPQQMPPPHPMQATPISATWSDTSDPFPFPPVPDAPRPWGPASPTLSSTSQGTFSSWASNSSAPPNPLHGTPLTHWAFKVFDGRHGSTSFRTRGKPTECFGRPEPPSCMERLASDSFLEVLRLPLDAATYYAQLWWRPSDHRARILLTTKDISGTSVRYCIPLTALKLKRAGPSLQLFRYSETDQDFKIWANLTFTIYEQLILFYCAFAALKSQDWKKYPDYLNDKYHKGSGSRPEEKEEFAGEIKDDNYLHALRVYKDRDSGGIRLEARARRGQFTLTPIWTAFVTDFVEDPDWIRPVGSKVLQLANLHPYVFCHGYTPPRGKSGKVQLQFTSSKDADAFIAMVAEL